MFWRRARCATLAAPTSLEKMAVSDNPRIDEDALWFLGKAYLMKQEAGSAMEAFKEVSEMQGRRYKQAQQMVSELEQLKTTPR